LAKPLRGFGLFVELVGVYVEGLVHVSALASDYYHFDPVKQRLLGERTGTSFQLGDAVTVQVTRVSLDDKKIDLELVEGSTRAKRRSAKSRDKGRGENPSTKKPTIKKKKDAKKGTKNSAKKAAKSPAKKSGAAKKKTTAAGKAVRKRPRK
jgi:ribonuclease R